MSAALADVTQTARTDLQNQTQIRLFLTLPSKMCSSNAQTRTSPLLADNLHFQREDYMKKVIELTARHAIADGKFDLSPVTAALGKANTKVLAMTAAASSAGMMMNIRILVENPTSAVRALQAAKISFAQNEALSFKLGNRTNALTQVTATLGAANTRILAMTAAASSAGLRLNVLAQVENPARAIDALERGILSQ